MINEFIANFADEGQLVDVKFSCYPFMVKGRIYSCMHTYENGVWRFIPAGNDVAQRIMTADNNRYSSHNHYTFLFPNRMFEFIAEAGHEDE